MPWLPINNGDGGKFESDPGANIYNSNGWDLFEFSGESPAFQTIEQSRSENAAFQGNYSLRAFVVAPGNMKNDQPMAGRFKITSQQLKTYAIRLKARHDFPNLPAADKADCFVYIKKDPNSPGDFIYLSNDVKYLNTVSAGNFFELRLYNRSSADALGEFNLYFNSTNLDDKQKLFTGSLYIDQVEYFEHEPLTSSIAITPMSYRNANDAVATVTRAGGSGSFTLLIERNEGGSFVFYNQQTVLEVDNVLDLVTNNMEPGDYRYTLTDNELDYQTTEEFSVANPVSTLDLIITKNDVSAAGLTDGSISLSATGDSGNYTFDISPKNGTEISASERTNLPAGIYTCSVTDTGSGETITENITVNDPASNLTLSLTKQDVTIPGLANGQITANAFGDTGVYAFSISPQTGQQDSNIFTGLAAGTYDVTVEDLNSQATVTQQIIIEEPAELAITITEQTNNPCFESEQGAVSLSVSGGTGPYSYLWNDGPTTLNRTGLSTGNHQIRITDSLGYSKVFTITITSPPRIVINITKTGQVVNVNVSGGVAPYSILWSDGSTESQRTLEVGSYIVQVTDDNGCTKSTTVEISDFKFYFSKNPVWLEKLTDPAGKLNLSWDAVVKIEKDYNSGTFETLFTANHPAREDGSTIFEFSEILKGQLQLALPEHKGKLPYVMEGNFKRFFVESNEKFGDPPAAQTAVTTETFHIFRGGLSREEFASDEFFSVFLDNPQTPFFSWEAIAKNVYPDQPEYLAYPLVNIGTSQIKIKAEAFDSENNLLFTKQTDFINGVQPYMLINFPVGFTQLGFSSIAGNTDIAYYTVEALNQSEQVISEKKYYYLNWKTQNNRKYFIYENALGVWATLVAEGNTIGSLEVEMEMLKKPVQFGYSPNQRTEQSENKVLKQSFTHSAGNIIEEEAFILADFIRSENVYEFTAKRWRPVSIEMGGDWFNTFEDSTPFEFTVMYEKDKNWTPDIYRLDNRRLESQDSQFDSIFKDYGFEGAYNTWGLPSLNDDRIIRSTAEKNSGNASAKFKMEPYQRMQINGQNLTPYNHYEYLLIDVTTLIKKDKVNVFNIFIKSAGISTTISGLGTSLDFTLLKKSEAEDQFTVFGTFIGRPEGTTFFKLDNTSGSYSNQWVKVGKKYTLGDYLVDDKFYLVISSIQNDNINAEISGLEVYFDDFSLTYENL